MSLNSYLKLSAVLMMAVLSSCKTVSSAVICDLESLRGKSFVYQEVNYTCKVNSPSSPRTKSWVNKIEVIDKNITLWGNICNDAPVRVGLKITELNFQKGCTRFIYNKRLFVLHGE
jgi:hypothetical protein